MTIKDIVMKRVTVSPKAMPTNGGGRMGTVWATKQELIAVFSRPQWDDARGIDDKVFYIWSFDTPRGTAQIRDYWSNSKTPDGTEFREHSISGDMIAVRWLKKFLKYHNFKVE